MSDLQLLEIIDTELAKAPAMPPAPTSLEETGLTESLISDLLLKSLFQQGARTGDELARALALPYQIIDDLLLTFQQRHFVEVLSTRGHGRGGYTLDLTQEGRDRAHVALEANRYVGPAPVTFETFKEWVQVQSIRHTRVLKEKLNSAFDDLVLPREVFDALGPALNSGGSIFLHGAPGNGKTAIAERLGALTSSSIYLPRALTIDGQIIVLIDPVYHFPVEESTGEDEGQLVRDQTKLDQRFAHVTRPTVFVGGELTMDQLDLRYDPHSKIYQAPFQLKATGGVLIVDDFGRQRMRPAELLNRWIVPLEKDVDTLSLHNGLKFPVPFDCHLVFATNLNPRDLVDESFLRRIQYKVEIKSPTREAFSDIMKMNCEEFDVRYESEAIELLFRDYYDAMGFPPRGCHPRDLLKQITSAATFAGIKPTLEPDLLHRAARSYFLVMEEEYVAGIPSLGGRRDS